MCDQKSWFDKDPQREIVLAPISDPTSLQNCARLAFLSHLSPSTGLLYRLRTNIRALLHTSSLRFQEYCIASSRMDVAAKQPCLYPRRGSFRFSFEALPAANNIHLHIYAPRDATTATECIKFRKTKVALTQRRRCLSHPIALNLYFVDFLFPLHIFPRQCFLIPCHKRFLLS